MNIETNEVFDFFFVTLFVSVHIFQTLRDAWKQYYTF